MCVTSILSCTGLWGKKNARHAHCSGLAYKPHTVLCQLIDQKSSSGFVSVCSLVFWPTHLSLTPWQIFDPHLSTLFGSLLAHFKFSRFNYLGEKWSLAKKPALNQEYQWLSFEDDVWRPLCIAHSSTRFGMGIAALCQDVLKLGMLGNKGGWHQSHVTQMWTAMWGQENRAPSLIFR